MLRLSAMTRPAGEARPGKDDILACASVAVKGEGSTQRNLPFSEVK